MLLVFTGIGRKKPQSARATNDNNNDNKSVDMNGNEYSRPNIRSVKSPGNRPMPIFFSHGSDPERIASAMKVVRSQRIMIAHS